MRLVAVAALAALACLAGGVLAGEQSQRMPQPAACAARLRPAAAGAAGPRLRGCLSALPFRPVAAPVRAGASLGLSTLVASRLLPRADEFDEAEVAANADTVAQPPAAGAAMEGSDLGKSGRAEAADEFASSAADALDAQEEAEEEDEAADEFEFNAPAEAQASQSGDKAKPASKSTAAGAPAARNNLPQTWEWEILALTVVLAYVGAFFLGSSVNSSLAAAWFNEFGDAGKLLPASFSTTQICSDPGSPFNKETPSAFRYYATGRARTRGLVVSLDLLPRQDLLSWVLAALSGDEDTITVEVFMDPSAVDPFVLAAAPRRDRRRIQKEARDLMAFASVVDPRKVDRGLAGLSILTDTKDALNCLSSSVVAILGRHSPALPTNRYAGDADSAASSSGASAVLPDDTDVERAADPLFRLLHITDRVPSYDRGVELLSNQAVRFKFKLPTASRMGELEELMRLALDVADRAASIKISKEALKRNKDMRARLEQIETEERDAEEGKVQIDENILAKRAHLETLKKTDRAAYLKERKRLETKMIRKRTKMVRK